MNEREDDERKQAASYRPEAPLFEIRVTGHLDAHWSAWFDGLSLTREIDGTTTMRGPVPDQAALHGLLQKVRDLGLQLVSVTGLNSEAPPANGTGRDITNQPI